MNRRVQRMGSLVQEELGRILVEDISDPTLRPVVINEVDLSSDLKNAKVFFSLTAGSTLNPKEVKKAMQRAHAFFRKKLADNMNLRYVPELNFVYDTHTDSVHRVFDLLKSVAEEGTDVKSP